jgi:hypothetical protein
MFFLKTHAGIQTRAFWFWGGALRHAARAYICMCDSFERGDYQHPNFIASSADCHTNLATTWPRRTLATTKTTTNSSRQSTTISIWYFVQSRRCCQGDQMSLWKITQNLAQSPFCQNYYVCTFYCGKNAHNVWATPVCNWKTGHSKYWIKTYVGEYSPNLVTLVAM